MKFKDTIFWSFKQIYARFFESFLIILGIALGISVTCGVVGIIDGYNHQLNQIYNSDFMKTFTIAPDTSEYIINPINKPIIKLKSIKNELASITFQDYLKIKNSQIDGIKGVWFSEHLVYSWSRNKSEVAILTTPDIFNIFNFTLVEGNFFTEKDMFSLNKVVIIGEKIAKEKFGAENPIGKKMNIQKYLYEVIGVFDIENSDGYVMGLGVVDELKKAVIIPYLSFNWDKKDGVDGTKRKLSRLFVFPDKQVEIKDIYISLLDFVKLNMPEGVKITNSFLSKHDAMKFKLIIGKVIGIFASAVLLIAAINILNLMMARVLKRYKNIGISRAIGARKKDIFISILTESLLLGFCGLLLSIVFIYGEVFFLKKITKLPIIISGLVWITGTLVALVISLIFGLYPAYKSTEIIPGEVVRDE